MVAYGDDEKSARARAAGIGSSSRQGEVGMVKRSWLRHLGACVATGALVFVALWGVEGAAQSPTRFVARLSTVPITVAMQDAVSGRGATEAVVDGNRLTITGTFEGLRTPATVARVHLAPRAMRGPAVADLVASKATAGTLSGTIDLTPQQLQALEKGALYIQVHSEKAPEGNLWGWLLPQETKR
jgi:hypothetical protein